MKKIYLLTFILTLLSFSAASAQTAVSPEKKKIIAEIIAVTKADKKADEMMMTMMSGMMNAYPEIIKNTIRKDTRLTEAQKSELETELIKRHAESSQKFLTRFQQKINFQEFIELTTYPLYDKFFTETELKELLAFYKTPTGQKLTDSAPQMAAEAIKLSQEIMLPKVLTIIDEMIKEDIKQVQPPQPVSN